MILFLNFNLMNLAKVKATTLVHYSIGTPKNNEFSICSKWKINYF